MTHLCMLGMTSVAVVSAFEIMNLSTVKFCKLIPNFLRISGIIQSFVIVN